MANQPMRLHWTKRVRVTGPTAADRVAGPTTRERLVAALADRPRTVAQLAQAFGLAQPTMLEHVRRALRAGLVVEVEIPEEERHFAVERYYATAVPVVRLPDRDILHAACRALADQVAGSLNDAGGQSDVHAAFMMTTLARDGWSFDDLWPYLHETICRLALERLTHRRDPNWLPAHGLAWVEVLDEDDVPFDEHPEEELA